MRNFYLKTLQLSVVFLLTVSTVLSCSKKESPKSENDDETPGYPLYLADPAIFYYEETYYLYGTNDVDPDKGFPVYTSSDMKDWHYKGYALQRGEAFGEVGFWAPYVWEYEGKFYMSYTANEKIAIAESTSPLGPFRQTNKTPLASTVNQIDPFVFIDDDGKKYLYHVRLGNGNRIYVAELTDDFSAIKTTTYKECLVAQTQTWERTNGAVSVVEGPSVVKQNGLYYLFYSANDFRNPDYAVGYAVSNSVYGPWTRYTGNPIISKTITGQHGSGHGDLIKDKENNLLYVFHTHHTSAVVGPRKTAIIKLNWVKEESGKEVCATIAGSFKYLFFKLNK